MDVVCRMHINRVVALSALFTTYVVAKPYVESQYHEDDDKDYYEHPYYNFEYAIHDPNTGDMKTQHEDRDGDTVRGFYTVLEPDGYIREVHYEADHYNGFRATVTRRKLVKDT